MDTVTVYVTAYILGFSLPDGIEKVNLGDDLIIWNVPPTPQVLGWSHRQHFVELGYKVEAGQNSATKAYSELEQAFLSVRLYSNGDLQLFLLNPSRVNPNPMNANERSSTSVSPGFPGAGGGRAKAYGWTPPSVEQLEKIKKEYPWLRKSKDEKLEVAKLRFADSYRRDNKTDRALDLVIALDSLLSEGADSIRYKVALRTAMLLATKGKERKEIFDRIYTAYGHRNTVVHGKTTHKKRVDAHKWFENNVYQLCDDVKRMLIYFMHRELSMQTLDPAKIEQHLFQSGILGLDLPEGS